MIRLTPVQKSRRHFTLIEMIVSMGLVSILLTSTLFFYRQIDSLNRRGDVISQQAFVNDYLSERLSRTLLKAQSPKKNEKSNYFFLTSENNGALLAGSSSLIFSYDNGVQMDKPFSNLVLGRLYIDPESRFCLATWPSPKLWEDFLEEVPMKNEVLLEEVESISFSFYVPPLKDKEAKETSDEELPRNTWLRNWSASYRKLPAIIRLDITKKGSTVPSLSYSYPLPNSKFQVIYDQ